MIRRLTNLRWKKHQSEKGLAAVIAGPPGSFLHDGQTQYATVSCLRQRTGWYWVARADEKGVPLHNSCDSPAATEDEAKAQAMQYVTSCLDATKDMP